LCINIMANFANAGFETDLSNWNAGKIPTEIATPSFWIKADAIEGLSDNDTISQWDDLSGSNYHVTQSTESYRPTYKTNIAGSLPAVYQNNSNYYLENTSYPAIGQSDFTWFAAARSNGTAGNWRTIFQLGTAGSNQSFTHGEYNGTLRWNNARYGNDFYVPTDELADDVWHANSGKSYSSDQYNGWWDLGDTSSGTVTQDINIQGNQISIGRWVNIGYNWNGYIGEVIIYTSALSDANRALIQSYLIKKWGVSVDSAVFDHGGIMERNTTTKYAGNASAKITVKSDTDIPFYENINLGTGQYDISCYAYTTGSVITNADLELYYNGSAVTTSFIDKGSGWYQLTATISGANESRSVGVIVKAGKTVYVDSFDASVSAIDPNAFKINFSKYIQVT